MYGYIKCKVGQKENLSTVTTDFLRKQVLQSAFSFVSRQNTNATAPSNPMSIPTNTV